MACNEIDITKYILKQICYNPYNVSDDDVLSWAEENSKALFGIELENYWNMTGVRKHRTLDECLEETSDKPKRTLKTLGELVQRQNIPDIFATGFDTSVDAIIGAFNLSPVAGRVFALLAYYEKYNFVHHMMAEIFSQRFSRVLSIKRVDNLANICGVDKSDLLRVMDDNDGELFKTELARVDPDGDIELYGCIRKLIFRDLDDSVRIKQDLMGEPLQSELSSDNFSHILTDYEYISCLLKNALSQHKTGINILLYGAPGTGKTEFAKSVCNNIGAHLYNLNQAINTRDNRISTLVRGMRLTSADTNTVLLMDEAEDVFSSYERRTSKLFLNQSLETNTCPIIWITNSISDMDSAFVRRFQYVAEIKKPDDTDQTAIWNKICDKYQVSLSSEKIHEYVRNYDVAPSVIEKAVAGAALTGKIDSIDRMLNNMQMALTGCPACKKADDAKFVPELLNTDTDLKQLADCLVKSKKQRFSLCLYGASGTGKSAYALYLADRLGMKCVHKRASDLKGMYVGETEKNIARAFREAADKKAVLVFDEADSFLQNREGAQRSWEVSAVNEMLTQMESHQYPFICTTNLMDKLDPASLRRFSFKVKYDFMTIPQVKLAFENFFAITLDIVPSDLTCLAPGDFVVVQKKCDILGISDTDEIIKMLRAEQDIKPAAKHKCKIGFAN